MTAAMLGNPKRHLDWNRSLAMGMAISINMAALGALAVMQPSWEPAALVPEAPVLVAEWLVPPPPLPDVPLAPPRRTVAATLPAPSKPAPVISPSVVQEPVLMDSNPFNQPAYEFPETTPATTAGIEASGGEPASRDAGVALPNPSRPPYPAIAVRNRMEGTVLLEIMVDATGAATQVKVIRGSGHHELDRSAREHVLREWSFQPALRDGQPIAARVRIPIEFSLATR